MMKKLIGLNSDEFGMVAAEMGLPSFVAKQLMEWVYKRNIPSVALMTNISLKNRERLQKEYEVGIIPPAEALRSADGTVKYLYNVGENSFVETVYIPEESGRATLCVSCQVGCKMNCRFCMTGKQGFAGNLTAGQILNQIFALPERDSLTNIVFMGMGEPCDNLNAVLRAVSLLTLPEGWGWSPKRITISTVGLKRGLKRLIEECDCHIAISLHSPAQALRSELMPAEKAYSMTEIIELLRKYDFSKQRRLSFEYILFKGVNDSLVSAKQLVKLLRGLDCRVNLIGYHAIPGVNLQSLPLEQMLHFRDYLTQNGLFATLRASRGEDVLAACGMLSTKNNRNINI